MDIKKYLLNLSRSHWYWLVYVAGGISLLSVALFHQYMLEDLPCVVCIQIRLWVSLLVIIAISGMALRRTRWFSIVMQFALVIVSTGLVERSYLLLGTERGFIFGDCGFDVGLPGWFAIEQWLPWLFQVETSCGYTPEIIFGVTMAEALMLMSVVLVVVTVSVAGASLMGVLKDRR